ncbi:MAG: hypothetical protein ACYCWA_02650 [Thiobacillus sp.]
MKEDRSDPLTPSAAAPTYHLSDEFALDPGLVYLNHAAVAPWPRRTVRAVERLAEENLR